MKSYRIIAAIILIPMIRGTFATELGVVGRYTAPPPASLEGGIGGDVQIRHVLFGDVYGMASLGYTTWGIQDASVSVSSPCSHWGLDQSRTGSVDDYHAGIGLGLRRPLPAGWSGQIETELSHRWLSGGAGTGTAILYRGHVLAEDLTDSKVQNTWILRLGGSVQRPFLGAQVVLGGGYAWDLDPQTVAGPVPLGGFRCNLSGAYAEVGLAWTLN